MPLPLLTSMQLQYLQLHVAFDPNGHLSSRLHPALCLDCFQTMQQSLLTSSDAILSPRIIYASRVPFLGAQSSASAPSLTAWGTPRRQLGERPDDSFGWRATASGRSPSRRGGCASSRFDHGLKVCGLSRQSLQNNIPRNHPPLCTL